jgi:hypothetical protein
LHNQSLCNYQRKQKLTKMKWISVEKREPDVKPNEFGYASEYYLVMDKKGDCMNARLEGGLDGKLYWYSPLFDDQINDVTHWCVLTKPCKSKK